MAKLEKHFVVRLGFYSSSRPSVDFIIGHDPSQEELEKLALSNQADFIDVFPRHFPVKED